MKPHTPALRKSLTAGSEPGSDAGFGQHAAGWWDADGPMAPLHRLNPVRLKYIKDAVCRTLGIVPAGQKPFKNLKIIDIGCGGGLVTEPLARLGGTVTGIDASPELIAIATDHAMAQGLEIDYRAVLSSELVKQRQTFDVVTALEVIEHVDDPQSLLNDIAKLLKPGGVAILSTPNRTPQSFLKGIIAAEYIARWVPRGTHDWNRFIKPSELVTMAEAAGLRATDTMGLHYRLLQNDFILSSDRLDVNYLMVLRHA